MHRKLLALAALATLSWHDAKATHVSGGEIIYECLGNGEYAFTMIIYRDCAGTTLGTSYDLDLQSPCGNQTVTVTQQSFSEVSQLCPNEIQNSTCNNGNLPGLEEYIFTGVATVPPCDFWTVSWSLCCRNDAIVNLQQPGTVEGYIETTFNNADYPCEDSPVFTSAPIPYVCLNQPVLYSYGVYDPDGDSLSYALHPALDAGGTLIGYVFPYTANEPITGITLDPVTGLLTFTPNSVGNFVVVVEVTQYDEDGNVIGTVMRDMQFVVIPCTNQAPDPAYCISNFSGTAVQVSCTEIELCESDNFCFDVVIGDPDLGDTLVVESNVQQNLPGSTISWTGTNPVTVTVCWTAQPGNNGFYPFTITVEDQNCPISAFQTYVFNTNVLQRTSAGPDQTICGPQVANIEAEGGANFVWSILPGGDPITPQNFICLDPPFCSQVIADPNSTTTYVVVSDLAGSCINSDTITVAVVSDFTYAVTISQSDDTLCLGETVQINVTTNPAIPGYTFEWTPSTGLSADDIPNPIAGYSQPGIYDYTVEITSPDGCTKQDTSLSVVVLPGFVPDFTVTVADDSFCEGQGTTFTVEIDNSPPIYCGQNFAGCTSGIVADFELGTDVIQGTTTSYPAPFGNWYNSAKHQVLIRASELQALGFTGGTINELAMNVAAVNGLSLYPGWQIHMGCTTLDSLNIDQGFVTGLFPVFGPTDVPITLGWNNFVLNPGFNWDGVSNVVVEFCFSNYPNGFTQNSPTFATNTGYTSVIYHFTDGANLCDTIPPAFFNQGESADRPNMRFRVCAGVNEDLLTFSWSPTVGLSDPNSGVTNVVPVTSPASYTVTVGDPGLGCFGTATVTTTWDPPADVSFNPMPNEGVAPLDVFFDNTSSGNVVSFNWNFGDTTGTSTEFEPTYTFNDPGIYIITLNGVSDQGCTGFYQDTVIVLPDPIVIIPNVFSPNGDGNNDAFEYADLRGWKSVEMTIYDRWGTKVYAVPQTASNKVIWKPSSNISEGTYYWVFVGVGNDGSEVKEQGHVTLLR